jgi:Lipopolysaccharide kinase (Kdo/WaaP) family
VTLPPGGSPGARPAAAREFIRLAAGPYQLHLRAELAPHAGALAMRLSGLASTSGAGAGNRGGGFRLALEGGPELFVRRARRGGAMHFVLDDIYFGLRPRPMRELLVTGEAARRGVPVAEPLGAAVRWVAPGLYRGFFITRAIPGMTLWEFVQADDDPDVRAHVLGRAREAIETMLRCGLSHPDLNLHNLFVTPRGESFAVIILDLDKARLYGRPLGGYLRRRIAARLMRSVRKLDPMGRYLDAAALETLNFA